MLDVKGVEGQLFFGLARLLKRCSILHGCRFIHYRFGAFLGGHCFLNLIDILFLKLLFSPSQLKMVHVSFNSKLS